MQTVGIALISIGLWVAYCAAYGISPLEAAQAIIRNPGDFRTIINNSKKAAGEKYANLLNLARSAGASVTSSGNPFSKYSISDDWQEHKARGSGGGIDYMMPSGTPLPALYSGTITNTPNNGTAGHTVTIKMSNGYKVQYMHMSKFLKSNGDIVKASEIVGLSGGAKGAEGSGSSNGPHLHIHMIDPAGTRINFLDYLGK